MESRIAEGGVWKQAQIALSYHQNKRGFFESHGRGAMDQAWRIAAAGLDASSQERKNKMGIPVDGVAELPMDREAVHCLWKADTSCSPPIKRTYRIAPAMPDEREGLLIIEHMAAIFYVASYKGGRPIVAWSSLSSEDRMRFINAMEAAVKPIPDRVEMKRGFFSASCRLDQTRDFILSEHDVSKWSVLYGW